MSNLSYCRFRNTVQDLDDCKDALDELMNGPCDDGDVLSAEELRAAKRLVVMCRDLVANVCEYAGLEPEDEATDEQLEAAIETANAEAAVERCPACGESAMPDNPIVDAVLGVHAPYEERLHRKCLDSLRGNAARDRDAVKP